MFSWGIRMALSGTLPILWGLATGRLADAVWVALTAEAISWVELKGSFTWRLRTLIVGSVLAVLAAILGSVTGGNIWVGCAVMFGVGFVSTLLKNIGDRASGLAICVYLLYIICNAFPVADLHALQLRTELIAIGAAWPLVVGVAASAFMPAQEPFRRHVALIWRSIANLAEAVSNSDNRVGYTHKLADVYQKETDVRTAINNSYEFFSSLAQQANGKDNKHYQLTMLRKLAGLVAVNVIAMGDEMEHVSIHELDKELRVKAAALFGALKAAANRLSVYVIGLNPEEQLLVRSQINRLQKLTVLIRAHQLPDDARQVAAITRILQLTERTIRLLENAILRIEVMGGDKPVFRSYSLIKTSFVLKPKYLLRNIYVLFNINTLTFRYAMRSAIAATVAMFVYKWFGIDHGFWITFSLMIVIQPYFGATLKKAIDRIVGTLLGILAGSFLLYIPQVAYLNPVILFITFVLMVYYVKRNYALSAFFITLNLMLLLNLEAIFSAELMVTRVVCTIAGSGLAIVSGWLVLPTWDKKWLPKHLANAIAANYQYYTKSFYTAEGHANWTRYKQTTESDNSNVFDSFNRYMQEPGKVKSDVWHDLITCNVRIARNLNNIHMEQAEKKLTHTHAAPPQQQEKINECLQLFNKVMSHMGNLHQGYSTPLLQPNATTQTYFALNDAQLLSLEKIMLELKTMQVDLEEMG
jgi:uncharacterized membrane protein YccC